MEERGEESSDDFKALANEDTLLRTHFADTNVSPFARARNICCEHKFCVRDKKKFLILFRNILCPQQMFPSLRSPRNIMGNNVSTFTRAFSPSSVDSCDDFESPSPSSSSEESANEDEPDASSISRPSGSKRKKNDSQPWSTGMNGESYRKTKKKRTRNKILV